MFARPIIIQVRMKFQPQIMYKEKSLTNQLQITELVCKAFCFLVIKTRFDSLIHGEGETSVTAVKRNERPCERCRGSLRMLTHREPKNECERFLKHPRESKNLDTTR